MNLAGPTLLAFFARFVACVTLVLALASLVWLVRRRWWVGLLALLVLGGAYAGVWIAQRPVIDHDWFYLVSNAKRSYSTYRALVWKEAFLPGCAVRESDSFRKLVFKDAAREAKFPTPGILSAYLAAAENPSARRALLVGPRAPYYRGFLEHAGLACADEGAAGKFDLVFVALEPDWICGARHLSAGAWRDLASRVTADGVIAWAFDTRLLSVGRFKRFLADFPSPQAHLWMPGLNDWLLVGRAKESKVKVDEMMKLFARPETFRDLAIARCETVCDLFANYVGARGDVEPALARTADESLLAAEWRAPRLAFSDTDSDQVRPEFFISRENPSLDWLSGEGVEGDIWKGIRDSIREMQNVRRRIVEGVMLAAAGKKEALGIWATAWKANPRDPLLRAVMDRFRFQAEALLEFGNAGGALRIYENLLTIRPTDPAVIRRCGHCLQQLGDSETARQVLNKAREIEKNENADKR